MVDPEALIGYIVDNQYRLASVAGTGTFGVVYAADIVAFGSAVGKAAVKVIWPQDEHTSAAISDEIHAMCLLTHPNLIAYKSSGELADGVAKGCLFIAMDLASESLAKRLETAGRLSPDQALVLSTHIGAALAYLAERGAVHSDVKPANILRVGDVWKLGDFGLVRGANAEGFGGMRGTLRYRAPEASSTLDPKSDVWSLGVVLQECLTGEFPYSGEREIQLLAQMAASEPRIADGLPAPLRPIVEGCLRKDTARRFTARQVLEACERARVADVRAKAPRAPRGQAVGRDHRRRSAEARSGRGRTHRA